MVLTGRFSKLLVSEVWVSRMLGCLAALVAFAALSTTSATSSEFSASQKSEMQAIIKDYLMANPEVLRDAIGELENRQKTAETAAQNKVVSDLDGPLYSSPNQAVIGNPNGKVTLIEFFDYNCGYCKHAISDLVRLMKDNPDLRVVLKDFPILSPGSVEAAQIASAARNQFKGDKFWEFHQKLLLSRGEVGKAQALAVAKDLGADMAQLTRDAAAPAVKTGLEETDGIAKSLMLNGTPSYVVGEEVVVGAVGYDALRSKLDNVRRCGKSICS